MLQYEMDAKTLTLLVSRLPNLKFLGIYTSGADAGGYGDDRSRTKAFEKVDKCHGKGNNSNNKEQQPCQISFALKLSDSHWTVAWWESCSDFSKSWPEIFDPSLLQKFSTCGLFCLWLCIHFSANPTTIRNSSYWKQKLPGLSTMVK